MTDRTRTPPTAADIARESRAAQGLPAKVADPVALDQLAALLHTTPGVALPAPELAAPHGAAPSGAGNGAADQTAAVVARGRARRRRLPAAPASPTTEQDPASAATPAGSTRARRRA